MKLLIAVPVFNEEKYVARVLREIRKYACDVLVVDDGSTDGTAEILRGMACRGEIRLLTHPENRGYGQSLIDAFAFAAGACGGIRWDWVITMDCDEQHEPSRIPAFVEAIRADDSDIVSGSRYMPGVRGDDADQPPVDRRNINRLMTELLNSTLGLGLTDSFCGFKAHRVSAMERLKLTIAGYAFPMQFWVQAMAAGLRIREIPVKLIYKDATRHFGGSLDDPTARLQHYLEVLASELQVVRQAAAANAETFVECGAVCCEAR